MSVDILSFRIELPDIAKKLVGYTLTRLEYHYRVKICISDQGAITVGTSSESEIKISQKLVQAITDRQFSHLKLFVDQPLIFDEHGQADYLGTATYMLHYLQEFSTSPDDFDELNRFKYARTYQSKFNCADRNLVLEYFIELVNTTPSLRGIKRIHNPSRLFVTHDIDILYHSIWPELKTACKNLRIDHILSLLFVESMRNTDQRLFQSILDINSQNALEATFFWMVSRGKVKLSDGTIIENANYSINSAKVQDHLNHILSKNQNLGIHCSIGHSSLLEEKEIFTANVDINRNHYLHGKLIDNLTQASEAGLLVDCTAGFSEVVGFRNSYGLPTRVFDFEKENYINVLEVPLNVMDMHIVKENPEWSQARQKMHDFIIRHKNDCVLSILWHNNYFSKYKYPDLLKYYQWLTTTFRKKNFEPIGHVDLIKNFL